MDRNVFWCFLRRGAVCLLLGLLLAGSAFSSYAFAPWSRVGSQWMNADGKTAIEGAVAKGITITKYQNRAGAINWKRVSGEIDFAMVRLGYRDLKDSYFDTNMREAAGVGIDTGVCFYGDALTPEEAREEAAYVLDQIKYYRVSYPIAYDLQNEYIAEQKLTKKKITEILNTFCEEIEAAGYSCVICGDYEWLSRNVDLHHLDPGIWYSRYGMVSAFPGRTIWRCTDQASVSGIKGNVCLEFSFHDYTKDSEDGFRTIGGKDYYFQGHQMVRSGYLEIDGQTYFFREDGSLESEK